MTHRSIPLATLALVLASTLALACDKAEGTDKSAKADADKKDATKDADKAPAAKTDEPPAEDAKPPEEPKPPAMEALAIADWGLTLQVPAGSKLGEVEAGDGMADTATIDAEAGCGVELELYRHENTKTGVADMFENATGPSGNKDDQFPTKTQTDTGYEVKRSWVIPLGDTMWSTEVGKVLGDHLVMCGAGSLMGVEEAQAECALKACQSLTLSEG